MTINHEETKAASTCAKSAIQFKPLETNKTAAPQWQKKTKNNSPCAQNNQPVM